MLEVEEMAITTGANNVIVGYQAGVDDAAAANK